MQIETVSVMISSRQALEDTAFTHEVYQTGPSAIPVTEIPIYQHLHGADSVSMIEHFGEIETTKKGEYDRLRMKFKNRMLAVYPTQQIPMPKAIADLDLEPGQLVAKKRAAPKVEEPA